MSDCVNPTPGSQHGRAGSGQGQECHPKGAGRAKRKRGGPGRGKGVSASGRAAAERREGLGKAGSAVLRDSRTQAGELRWAAASVTLRGQKSEQVSVTLYLGTAPSGPHGRAALGAGGEMAVRGLGEVLRNGPCFLSFEASKPSWFPPSPSWSSWKQAASKLHPHLLCVPS